MTQGAVATRILPGAPLRDHLLRQVAAFARDWGKPIKLAIIQVGDNPSSSTYVRNKLVACAKVGLVGEHIKLRKDEGEKALHSVIGALARDPDVHAIIVQTPLPSGWDTEKALNAVPASKDIDGLSAANIELRRKGNPSALWPATPLGIIRILHHLHVDLHGCKMAIIGRGMVVGAPLREILVSAGADVISIDKETPHPAALCARADVVISAAGVPRLVGKEWIKPGAIVLDVGLTRKGTPSGKSRLVGDINRMEVEGIASVLTPAPGGIGPLTVASLFTNIIDAVCLQNGKDKVAWRLDAAM